MSLRFLIAATYVGSGLSNQGVQRTTAPARRCAAVAVAANAQADAPTRAAVAPVHNGGRSAVIKDIMGDVVMGDVGSKTTVAFGDAGASARYRGSARGGAHGSLLPPPSAGSRGIPLATFGGSATIR